MMMVGGFGECCDLKAKGSFVIGLRLVGLACMLGLKMMIDTGFEGHKQSDDVGSM